jgi:transposase-like protein
MKRRQWDSKTKALIVLQGLKGKPVAEVCNEHQISQAQYYQWRDQFLANAPKAFDTAQVTQKEERQRREIDRLKHMVGELTMELKKSEEVWS